MLFLNHSGLKGTIIYFLVFLTLIFSFGCFHEFYKVKSADLETFRETVHTGKIKKQKYYVLHQGEKAMRLSDISFQGNHLKGTLSDLPPLKNRDRQLTKKVIRYQPNEKSILQEVHLFLKEDAPLLAATGDMELDMSAIDEIQLYDKAVGATIASHVGGVVGISAGIMMGVALIYESGGGWGGINVPKDPATGEYTSCPFVYAYDGTVFRLQGEVFAGAIFPNLERHDYLPLPDIQPIDGGYQVRISNEQKELQHINLAELVVVEHPMNSTVLLDQNGAVHTISDPQAPVIAQAPDGQNLLPLLRQRDREAYYFEAGDELQNYVDMEFEKPQKVSTAKLVLNTKESFWATSMLGVYTRQLGSSYPQWADQLAERPAEEINQLLSDQGLHLAVHLWTENTWKLVTDIKNIGPIAFRDIVVPIDLSGHEGNKIRVKVTGGHLFWEVNYAAMDFTDDADVYAQEIKPGFAKASDGNIYTDALTSDDDQYLHQTYDGNQVTIWYPAHPARSGYEQHVFLHTKGHYEPIMDYDGPPDLLDLPPLDQPGSFIEFSKDHFQDYLEANKVIR